MTHIKIGEALTAGWHNFKRRPWYLLGLTLAVFILFACTSSQGALATALSYIIYGGYLLVLIRHFNGEHIMFDDLFNLDGRWVSFAFLGVIKGLLILLGLICFIIPGIYLAVRFMFAELLIIDRGMRPLEALRASSAMTKGRMWPLFGFTLVAILLMILGLFALIVGAFVAMIVVSFATIKIYRDIQASQG